MELWLFQGGGFGVWVCWFFSILSWGFVLFGGFVVITMKERNFGKHVTRLQRGRIPIPINRHVKTYIQVVPVTKVQLSLFCKIVVKDKALNTKLRYHCKQPVLSPQSSCAGSNKLNQPTMAVVHVVTREPSPDPHHSNPDFQPLQTTRFDHLKCYLGSEVCSPVPCLSLVAAIPSLPPYFFYFSFCNFCFFFLICLSFFAFYLLRLADLAKEAPFTTTISL